LKTVNHKYRNTGKNNTQKKYSVFPAEFNKKNSIEEQCNKNGKTDKRYYRIFPFIKRKRTVKNCRLKKRLYKRDQPAGEEYKRASREEQHARAYIQHDRCFFRKIIHFFLFS